MSLSYPVAHQRTVLWVVLVLVAISLGHAPAAFAWQESGDAQWIWAPDQQPGEIPPGTVYFRRVFNENDPERGQVEITCDDAFTLYVNGREVASDADWHTMKIYDIHKYLSKGRNVVAVRAENSTGGDAGLVALVTVKRRGGADVSYSTNDQWRVSTEEIAGWEQRGFKDGDWEKAVSLGEFGRTEPWGNQVSHPGGNSGRFKTPPNFAVERVASPQATGGIVAMAFNERGEIIASQERGPLLIVRDADGDGVPEAVSTYCDLVKNCQGILPLNGMVFAVGSGPEGVGMYRIEDENRDGTGDKATKLLSFKGDMGEHGPHAPVLGPDGLIYVMLGNHTAPDGVEYDPRSQHHHYYEGDLLQPKYEDAGGHAVGIKAPGGVVIRTDIAGSFVELYTGGFRNAYDMAFNARGDLFTFDSDMEWDEGLPWYRPTRVNHCIPGAEFGWRSGWSKWPDYFVDSLPSTIDIGRGSPTGVEFYNHRNFPTRYQDAFFMADWSMGRILAVKMQPAGGTYQARTEVFLTGRPLNVTDVAVGPDGGLYFSTGGRGTEGGIYRVVYTGKIPPPPESKGVMQAIRQPQLQSAWGRDRVAVLKREVGTDWDRQLPLLAADPKLPALDRVRALDLMQLVGPFPTSDLLVRLSTDTNADVRAKAATLMGIHYDDATNARLVELLGDADPTVRRRTCESLVAVGHQAPVEKLIALLNDPNRFVAWSARRALEQVPQDQWKDAVLGTDKPRQFVEGVTALLVLEPDRETAEQIISGVGRLMRGFVNDADFIGLLRVAQVALNRGGLTGDDVPEFRRQLAEEYPSLEPRMNRELVRLLVYLQATDALQRMSDELARADNPLAEKIHLGTHLRFMNEGWTTRQKLDLLRFYEFARSQPGGHSYKGYMDNFGRDFVALMTEDEKEEILAHGAEMPTAALAVIAKLPAENSPEVIDQLIALDRELASVDSDSAKMVQTGVVAVLAISPHPAAMSYLRELFETVPDRRQDAAMGLAQQPGGENWPLLLRALPILDGGAAQEVIMKLGTVDQKPEQPEPVRQVILAGLRLKNNGSNHAVGLLKKWTGQDLTTDEQSWDVALAEWQKWFASSYPNEPPAELPQVAHGSKWTFDELRDFLQSAEGGAGNAQRGGQIFAKAQCIKCHRYGSQGEGIGPDLTTVSQRFQQKEILESVIFPSQVISDQYASKSVVTSDGLTYTGIVGDAGTDAVVVLQSTGEKRVIPKADIDEIVPHAKSAMPEGLFNELALEEIADLFAYLKQPPVQRSAGR
ncbi:MAG: HEAT repeat domain-containing protein [Pirellulales bacterium]|nr:HEAT repeat domain-containing protein [Pirellulales bacterium]